MVMEIRKQKKTEKTIIEMDELEYQKLQNSLIIAISKLPNCSPKNILTDFLHTTRIIP